MITLLERPYQVCFSRNPVAYKLQTNTALSTQGLKIDVRLMFRRFGANDFIQQIAISLVPDSSGIAEIDFSKVLDSLVDYSLPAITTAVPERAFDQVGEFYVGYREITTAAPNPAWTTDSSTIRVIKGGLPYEKWQGPNYFINNNSNCINSNNSSTTNNSNNDDYSKDTSSKGSKISYSINNSINSSSTN